MTPAEQKSIRARQSRPATRQADHAEPYTGHDEGSLRRWWTYGHIDQNTYLVRRMLQDFLAAELDHEAGRLALGARAKPVVDDDLDDDDEPVDPDELSRADFMDLPVVFDRHHEDESEL